MSTSLEPLINDIWDAVTARPDKLQGRRIDTPKVIPQVGEVVEGRFSKDFPVLRHLDKALSLAKETPLSNLAIKFEQNLDKLMWSQNASYTEEVCSRTFLDGYAYAGLSGPDGPVFWAAPRTGVMLMGPNVLYPGHNHAPREFYLLLTPGAQWRLDGGEWFDVDAGDLVYHESWQMHEMRTLDQPMLAFAGWMEAGDRGSIAWDPDHRAATS